MAESALSSFNCPATHEQISTIIRERSTNRQDLRDVALRDLDLSAAERILDLGCGFGFMSEAIARRAPATAQVIGVDMWPANRRPFLGRVRSTGRRVRFVRKRLRDRLPWPDRSFDVVVCSFSLYFFAEVLPEVARVLTSQGLLLAATHTRRSVAELLRVTGLTDAESELPRLIGRFSAENGNEVLAPWFVKVDRVPYRNVLSFSRANEDDLVTYLSFKLPFLVPRPRRTESLRQTVAERARLRLARQGHVPIRKDEAIFRCREPIFP